MRAYGVRGAHWEAKIIFFKIKWFLGMTRCHACLRNSALYPKKRLGSHMYQCWVLTAKPPFRWHAVDFSGTNLLLPRRPFPRVNITSLSRLTLTLRV